MAIVIPLADIDKFSIDRDGNITVLDPTALSGGLGQIFPSGFPGGASVITIADAGGYWDAENVEDVIAVIGNYAFNRVSKGWYTGGVVTCNPGKLTVNVTSGTGNWGGTRNVSWNASANVVIIADVLNYIYVDTADSGVKATTTRAIADAQIPLAIVLANATEGIKISPYRIEISDFHYQVHKYLQKVIGPVCETGMSVSINTPAGLNIVVDTGSFHWGLFHYDYTTESPCSFTYWHKVTDGGITRWVKIVTQTFINNTKYNLNTGGNWTYENLGNNKYRKDLVCVAPKTNDLLHIAVILGQEQFSNLAAARNGSIPTLGDLETMGLASLGYIIIKQGATAISEVGDMRPLVGQYGGTQDHGSLTGLGNDDHPQYILGTLMEGSDIWEPGSIAVGAMEAKDITVVGAILGDCAIASFSLDVADLILTANVTALDTVTCVLANNTAGAVDLGSGTIKVKVFR